MKAVIDTTTGFPLKINREDFRRYHLQSFPKMNTSESDSIIDNAIETVYTMFSGVQSIWENKNNIQIWFDKTRLCYLQLVAWYICDNYPQYSALSAGMGGAPLKSKQIGGVKIMYQNLYEDTKDTLKLLNSNGFGRSAYIMIKNSAKVKAIR